jgi:hypothetical protein
MVGSGVVNEIVPAMPVRSIVAAAAPALAATMASRREPHPVQSPGSVTTNWACAGTAHMDMTPASASLRRSIFTFHLGNEDPAIPGSIAAMSSSRDRHTQTDAFLFDAPNDSLDPGPGFRQACDQITSVYSAGTARPAARAALTSRA